MTKLKQSLGRGLDALIKPHSFSNSEKAIETKELKKDDGSAFDILVKIPVQSITPNPFQPRTHFDQKSLDELKKSILQNGLIQPITVRRNGDHNYELISGERRVRAFREIGYLEIPAFIIKVDSNEIMLAMALIENIQRDQLNPIEIGMAYRRLMDECNLTQEQIADKVGKDRTTITNSIRLLKLPEMIKQSLIQNEISSGHARALINLPNEKIQLDILEQIKNQNLSVRKVEQLVKKYLTQDIQHKKKTTGTQTDKNVVYNHMQTFEDKLRRTFGTKVICRQRHDGSGDVVIEFYSNDEFERLFELFELIDKTYH
jgi:ParB family transcriptional regulator, chromosome partitioning protein